MVSTPNNIHKSPELDTEKNALPTEQAGVEEILSTPAGSQAVLSGEARDAFEVGYRFLGPLSYAFTSWVAERARDERLEKLFFVAREGWFLQKVYRLLAPRLEIHIPSQLMYASRRALRMPLAVEPVAQSIIEILGEKGRLRRYLENVELEVSIEEIRRFGFSGIDDPIDSAKQVERLAALLSAHEDELIAMRDEERLHFVEYADSIGFKRLCRAGLVDSGWFGTSQRALTNLLRESGYEVQLTGLYIALTERGRQNFSADSTGFGFVHHFYRDDGTNFLPFLELARVMEVLLSAPMPSCRRIKVTAEGPQPAFVSDPQSARLHPTCELIQQGAIEFVRECVIQPGAHMPPLSRDEAVALIEQFLNQPTMQQARLVGRLPYDASGFNDDADGTFLPLSSSDPSFLLSPRKYLSSLNHSRWHSGYHASRESSLARAFLRIASPLLWNDGGLAMRINLSVRGSLRRAREKLRQTISRPT